MPARGMRSGAAGRSEVDTNGSARRLDISLDRFRETKIALLLAICESRMTLVVPWTLGTASKCRNAWPRRGGGVRAGTQDLRALLAF